MRKPARMFLVVCISIGLVACEKPPTTAATEVESSWLSRAAAEGVDGRGRFRLAAPPPDQLGESAAVRLAEEYVRQYGRFMAPMWSEDRDGAIDHETLSSCGRTYYASSTYDDLPEPAVLQMRAHFGPRWFVTMCAAGIPQVSVAVSAFATDPKVLDGQLGGVFVSRGIPASLQEIIMPPEEAARLVHEATGRKVSNIPELIVPPLPSVPQLAKWLVTVEEPVVVRGENTKSRRPAKSFYVGAGRTWDWIGLQVDDAGGRPTPVFTAYSDAGPRDFGLRVRAGRAGSLEPATVEKP